MIEFLDVPSEASPPRGGRRLAALAAAVALTTAAGGFLAGRASAPDDASSVAATADAEPDTIASESGSTDTGAAGASDESADTTTVGAADAAGMPSAGGSYGQYSPGAYEEPSVPLLAERTTADGVLLRAHLQSFGDAEGYSPYSGWADGWAPAAWCFPTGQVRLSLVTATAVQLTWAPWYTDPRDGLSISTFAAGYAEGTPVFGAVVQTAGDATGVTFATSGGAVDSSPVTGGVALVAVTGPIDPQFTITVDHADGTSTPTSSGELMTTYDDIDYRMACEPPPPALPTGGDQPADPATAEGAVREAWRVSRDFAGTDSSVRRSYIDDDTGIQEAWDALESGQYAEAAKTATATIREFSFASPTEAWFRYDIETSITDFVNRYGMARLGDDGVWRITRQTVCQDLSLAPGNECIPAVETLLPPSAANDPRYSSEGEMLAE